jgi:hypothetical protein
MNPGTIMPSTGTRSASVGESAATRPSTWPSATTSAMRSCHSKPSKIFSAM